MGENDADQGVDLDSFEESYSSLLDGLASENRRLIVSGLLTRESVNLDPYNECLKALCEAKDIEFIDHYNGFLLASGDMAESYFYKDKVHANSFGKRNLLRNIDTVHRVTNPDTNSKPAAPAKRECTFSGQSGFPSNERFGFPSKGKGYHNRSKYCHICSMNGHSTQ